MSKLAGCELIYHPMKCQALHVNLKANDVEPTEQKLPIDKWHVDTTPYVLVVFCTDPEEYTGGELQYFKGTRDEGINFLSTGDKKLPQDRVHNVGRQIKGYGVMMQGSRVFHQASNVLSGRNRTTMVFSFCPRNVLALEALSRLTYMYNKHDPLHYIMPDWVRFRAWRISRRLELWRDYIAENKDESTRLCVSDDENISDSTYLYTNNEELQSSIDKCRHGMLLIVKTLPYIDDRNLLTKPMLEGISDLRTFLIYRAKLLLPPQQTVFTSSSIEEKSEPSSLVVSSSELTENGAVCSKEDRYGWGNLIGAVQDVDNCVQDIYTLRENESQMIYF